MNCFNIFLVFLHTFYEVFGNIPTVTEPRSRIAHLISSLITQQTKAQATENQNVAMIRFEQYNLGVKVFAEIRTEILKNNPESPLYAHEIWELVPKYRVHSSSFFIVVTDVLHREDLGRCLKTMLGRNFWSDNAKFIVVATRYKETTERLLLSVMLDMGVSNSIIIRENATLEVFMIHKVYENLETHLPAEGEVLQLDVLFPDRFSNMHGREIKMLTLYHPPRVIKPYDKVYSVDNSMLEIFVKKKNATLVNLPSRTARTFQENNKLIRRVMEGLRDRTFDLTLNTFIFDESQHYYRTINTYDTNAFCAVVPSPPRTSFIHFLLTPFDLFTWIVTFATVCGCAATWKIFQKVTKSSSVLYFVFGVIANFVGQSIPFKFNHRVQTTVLQCCILMTFILGNAYQSLIISSMSFRDAYRFKTFAELFNSDYFIDAESYFFEILENSGEYPHALKRIIVPEIFEPFSKEYFEKKAEEKFAIVRYCDTLEFELNVKKRGAGIFYMLPDRIRPFYTKFPLCSFSPYFEVLQEHFNAVFEVGIRRYQPEYDRIHKLELMLAGEYTVDGVADESETQLLIFDDLFPIFYILGIGYAVSFLVFLCEKLSTLSFKKIKLKVCRKFRVKRAAKTQQAK